MRVDPSTLTGVLATVEQLSQRGSVLAESTVPRFFNGAQIDALSLEATSMIADAKRARQLLGSSPVELLLKDRLAAMAHAGISASNTGAIKPTIGVLREFGRTARDSLRITLGDARAEIANSTDQVLVDIRSATPRNLATTAVDDLRAAIQLRDAVQLPPLTVGARPLYPFDLPVGDPSAHVRLLQRPHAQSQGLFRDLDAAARRIEEVVGPDPAALTTIDAAELRVLLETGPDATWALPRMVGSRPLVEVVDQLSRGMDDGLRQ